jgi:hypothetical protein
MKLTQKIWDDFNSPNDVISKKAAKQGDQAMKSYWRHIEKILPRHRLRAQNFFNKAKLYNKVKLCDGTILSISIGDLLAFSKTTFFRKTNSVVIKVLHPELNKIYILCYSWLKSCKIQYKNDMRGREIISYTFDSWHHDKFSLTKDKWLKHEIFLVSGASVKLEFRHFSYKIKHFKNNKEMLKTIKQIVSYDI